MQREHPRRSRGQASSAGLEGKGQELSRKAREFKWLKPRDFMNSVPKRRGRREAVENL